VEEQYLRDKEIFPVPKLFSSIGTGIHSSAPKYQKYLQHGGNVILLFLVVLPALLSVVDPDPGFYLDPDPDPGSQTNTGLEPDPCQTLPLLEVELLTEKYTLYIGIRS
jgi:hypothetical protein